MSEKFTLETLHMCEALGQLHHFFLLCLQVALTRVTRA